MRILQLAVFVLSLACPAFGGSKGDWRELDGRTQGTTYRVHYFGAPEKKLEKLIVARLQGIDETFSNYRKDSKIERFNAQSSTEWQTVSPELARLLQRALEFSRATDGAFDVTIGQLMKIWGFGPFRRKGAVPSVPSDASIAEALHKSGHRNLEVRLNPPAVKKLIPDLIVDLSGIGQGYTVDQLAEVLEKEGITSYLVEVGGELRARGKNKDGDPWQVAIENPSENAGVGSVLGLQDIALSTSGNYRDYVDIGGKRYSHIFDPRKGRPIPSEFVSASVMAKDCTTADALAKAFLILPEKDHESLARTQQLSVQLQFRTEKGFQSKQIGSFESSQRR